MGRVKFEVVNGKWQTGNLNMKTVAASFDVFINLRRKPKKQTIRVRRDLSIHNYTFNYGKTNEKRNEESHDSETNRSVSFSYGIAGVY